MNLSISTRLLSLLTALALLSACSDDPGENQPENQNQQAPDAGPADTNQDPESDTDPGDATEDLSGTWAQLIHISAFTELPFVGQVENETISIQLLTIDQDGLDLAVTAETCSIVLQSTPSLAETIIPDAFIRSLEIATRPATLTVDGDRVDVFFPSFVEVRGANLDDPLNDPLPTDPDDPRVFDQDEDGNPGLTVRVTGLLDGEIYVVQRGANELTGQVFGADRFDGLVEWENEQEVLGADNALLEDNPDTVANPDPAASFFRTTRVADDADCANLIADADALFAR